LPDSPEVLAGGLIALQQLFLMSGSPAAARVVHQSSPEKNFLFLCAGSAPGIVSSPARDILAAIRPGERFRTVISGVDDDGVVGDAGLRLEWDSDAVGTPK